MKRVILVAMPLLLMSSFLYAEERVRVDEIQARSLFANYFEREESSPERYDTVDLKPFGESIWLIYATNTSISPSIPLRYIMYPSGQIMGMGTRSLGQAFSKEYNTPLLTETDRQKLIQEFIKLDTVHHSSIISGTSDIPGYQKAPLDPDIAQTVRAPSTYGNYIVIVYTYEDVGGVVKRYRFNFNESGVFENADSVELAMHIGERSLLF